MGTTTTTTTSTTTTTIPVPSDPFEASAFLAFRELGIPAIRYSVDEEAMVAAVVVEALDEAMLAALSDHKNVVADSVRPLVTLDAALTAEDAVEVLLDLLLSGEVIVEVNGHRAVLASVDSSFLSTTTTTTATTSTTSTTTATNATGTTTEGPDQPAASATSAAEWQIAVGAIGGVVVIAVVVTLVVIKRRDSGASASSPNKAERPT